MSASTTVNESERARFAEIIQELEQSRGKRELARSLGVSHNAVRSWLKGTVDPKLESLEQVAAMRGETLENLLNRIRGREIREPLEQLTDLIRALPFRDLIKLLRLIVDILENRDG
ncbi:hypothetical protein [Laspinema olomoucense]|uniref:hypothetical protein n=1 Tax=Laspinema olomoucense TaxID=3231600 RepID=UPI0021BB96D5|nr:hypothetical protein [Laspinema sp. D3d]MCT7971275.1 hypothetical protein [Laspinema sp. D3d]